MLTSSWRGHGELCARENPDGGVDCGFVRRNAFQLACALSLVAPMGHSVLEGAHVLSILEQ